MLSIITLAILTLIGIGCIWLEEITDYEYSSNEGVWSFIAIWILGAILVATPSIIGTQYNAYLHNQFEYEAAECKVKRITEVFTDYKAENIDKAINDQDIIGSLLSALPESSEGFKFKTEVMNSVVKNIEILYNIRKKMEYINRHPWWIFKYDKFPWEDDE